MADVACLRQERDVITIYVLFDPRDDEPYYVGQAKDPDERLSEHLYAARSGEMTNLAFRRWLLTLDAQDLAPVLYVRCQCRGQYEADIEETKAIREFQRLSPDLLNLRSNPGRSQARPFTDAYLRRVGAI